MSVRELSGTTAIVTGASRGFGRATAISLAALGAHVVGVARNEGPLRELREQLGEAFTPEVADVADPSLPARLYSLYRPQTVVLNAGATPKAGTLQEQTWETFSSNWNVDVQHVFNFIREALTAPLDPGSVVVSLSSGAALPRITAERWICRRKVHDQVHQFLRRVRSATERIEHSLPGGSASANACH